MSEQFDFKGISIVSTFKNNEILSSKHMSIDSITAENTAKCFKLFILYKNIKKGSILSSATSDLN